MLVKEVCGRQCVIREKNYDSSLGKFMRLFNLAQTDFPTLIIEQIRVVQFGGEHIKRQWGIEFTAPPQADIPKSYTLVSYLENDL